MFQLSDASDNHPLRYIGHELFNRYELFSKFKVSDNASASGLLHSERVP